ncbi:MULTISPECIES: biotin--[acetyl-CoA-carboxylase] ligase [unclassified Curtobacterium]|uniref:biotin--[acetyl-CoA-carboxylase] ligase n=1 Tax=unclassified Curtobacterium TaxID=257496 RepID=UPI000D98EE9F|nr:MULTISPECIES: biotin--[acetyl-CoA-carboxylase] ligase [unclassified Curtobacterium]PYY40826.1 biotin--[acetyl-CoA-carboxylase] ligase [Curtobacterium sp. MCPF17_046]WIB14543.1 biotin--[acetyl-CoA-carboxylase] ligase [Curtobacterium sp. MCPF17_050]
MSTPVAPSFPRARALVEAAGATFVVHATTGSTNADLLRDAPGLADGSVVVTLDQTAGRGRLDRSWVAPAGQTLAASVLVRAGLEPRDRGWLPLVAGAAVRDAVAGVLAARAPEQGQPDEPGRSTGQRVLVKWPNDVLVDGRKVSGVLCQVASDGSVVVGVGVNTTIPVEALPTPTATSLLVAGATEPAAVLADTVLADLWTGLQDAVSGLAAGGAAAEAVRSHVRAVCGTVGQRVRLELPDGSTVEADATGVDDDGRITIRDRSGVPRGVAVGDVTHLRYA